MKVLVTGSAGFIGSALSIKLLDRGDSVIGIDNHNNYYDPLRCAGGYYLIFNPDHPPPSPVTILFQHSYIAQ